MRFRFLLLAVPLVSVLSAADPAVEALLHRKVPALEGRIRFEELPAGSPAMSFQLSHQDGEVVVRGDSTNSRAAGLHWYLKHGCGMHFSWSGDQTAVPSPLPLPEEPLRTSPWRWRSVHNHCVFSYSMAFWDWPRWEREIDFLALNGVNQAFLLTGHEKVWQNTLRRLGFSDAQIATWLPSTSHLSWWHFDNLQGEGGPLTQQEIDQEAVLARQVADRMRAFGIEPVALGFYGMVPSFFGTRFPAATLIPQGDWVGGYARPPILDPSDPAFATTAAIYYEELQKVLGPVKHFGGDPFHEGGRTGGLDLGTAFKKIQDAMLAATPEAVWVMFGWQANPNAAGLAQLQPAHVLVQQTSIHPATAVPVSGSFRNFGAIPWTWNLIDNFGGNHGLYGNFDTLATLPSRFLKGAAPGNFAGLGHSPEAIETNPLEAALYYEMFWRDADVEVSGWLDEEIPRRYGAASPPAREAWELLARSSYRCPVAQEGISDYVFGARPGPGVSHARTWASNDRYWCELDGVEAWQRLLEAAPQLSGNGNFRYDLVDVTRHVLNFHSKRVYDEMMAAFTARDRPVFEGKAAELLGLFDDLDAVLASDRGFLLGTWLERAKAKGHDAASTARIERNARNLVTLWNGSRSDLNDYSSRSWAGLVGNYYKSRWSRYLGDLRNGWGTNGTPAYTGAALEEAFLTDRTLYPTEPQGDSVALSAALYQRLAPALRKGASLRWSLPQEPAGEVTLRFDVTERYTPGQPHQLTLSRQYGSAAVTLKRVKLMTSGGAVLGAQQTAGEIPPTGLSRSFAVAAAPPAGQRVLLEIVLQGPAARGVANGPVDFAPVFTTSRTDYVGRFQYASGGNHYFRELREDGGLALYVNGAAYAPWAGYTWQFVNGEARLFTASGALFERHRLTDMATLVFQMETNLGPAKRMPLSSFYQRWAEDRAMADADPAADTDQDGLSNLEEFLFGGDPSRIDQVVRIEGFQANSRRRRDALLEAIRYELQTSSDLIRWRPWDGAESSSDSPTPGYLDVGIELPRTEPSLFVRQFATGR